jgi:hypothetical protein
MIFLVKLHQAIVLLQGILFGTFAVVLVGHLAKVTKTNFLLKLRTFLRGLYVLTAEFSPLPS